VATGEAAGDGAGAPEAGADAAAGTDGAEGATPDSKGLATPDVAETGAGVGAGCPPAANGLATFAPPAAAGAGVAAAGAPEVANGLAPCPCAAHTTTTHNPAAKAAFHFVTFVTPQFTVRRNLSAGADGLFHSLSEAPPNPSLATPTCIRGMVHPACPGIANTIFPRFSPFSR